jgi:hypothetical protein
MSYLADGSSQKDEKYKRNTHSSWKENHNMHMNVITEEDPSQYFDIKIGTHS